MSHVAFYFESSFPLHCKFYDFYFFVVIWYWELPQPPSPPPPPSLHPFLFMSRLLRTVQKCLLRVPCTFKLIFPWKSRDFFNLFPWSCSTRVFFSPFPRRKIILTYFYSQYLWIWSLLILNEIIVARIFSRSLLFALLMEKNSFGKVFLSWKFCGENFFFDRNGMYQKSISLPPNIKKFIFLIIDRTELFIAFLWIEKLEMS